MHGPAVYLISVLLFVLSGLLLFAAGSSWARVASRKNADDRLVSRASFRAAAGLTAASLGLLGAAILWAVVIVFFLRV